MPLPTPPILPASAAALLWPSLPAIPPAPRHRPRSIRSPTSSPLASIPTAPSPVGPVRRSAIPSSPMPSRAAPQAPSPRTPQPPQSTSRIIPAPTSIHCAALSPELQRPSNPQAPTEPNDFTLGLQFTSGGLNGPNAIAIDGSGNVWVTNSGSSTVTELSSSGAATAGSPYSAGGMNGVVGIAIDLNTPGNAWIANDISAPQPAM